MIGMFARAATIGVCGGLATGDAPADTTICSVVQPVSFEGVDIFHVDAIHALAVWDDGLGGGPMLYAGGELLAYDTSGSPLIHLLRWNGKEWMSLSATSTVGTDSDSDTFVHDLLPVPPGSPLIPPGLYVIGKFDSTYPYFGGPHCKNIGRWNGETWSYIGQLSLVSSSTQHLELYTPPGGTATLYAGGKFTIGSPFVSDNLVKLTPPSTWSALPATPPGNVGAMQVFDDGTGPVLVVAKNSGVSSLPSHIWTWDGSTWTELAEQDGPTLALTVWDDGNGPALYTGGVFSLIGGVAANNVAKWDGRTWSPLGTGLGGLGGCYALAGFNDGFGEALYVGGNFTSAGGMLAKKMAKWDGKAWSPVGAGVDGTYRFDPYDLGPKVTVIHAGGVGSDGTTEVFVGGEFQFVGSMAALSLGRMETYLAYQPADLFCDGTVDGTDLAMLLAAWGDCSKRGACPADLDDDGIVTGSDLAILLGEWS